MPYRSPATLTFLPRLFALPRFRLRNTESPHSPWTIFLYTNNYLRDSDPACKDFVCILGLCPRGCITPNSQYRKLRRAAPLSQALRIQIVLYIYQTHFQHLRLHAFFLLPSRGQTYTRSP